MDPSSGADEPAALLTEIRARGVKAEVHEADLSEPAAVVALLDSFVMKLEPFSAVVAAHCRDVGLPLMQTSAEEFDRHFAVNARSVALLLKQFAQRLPGNDGRFVAFTSDALQDNVPYGVSKGALDRIVLAAARELGVRGIRVNCINPGPTDTGWIKDETRNVLIARTPLGRVGQTSDSAALVRYLLSADGGWITGQILHSDGGFR